MKNIYIIIINWNGTTDTIECLESIFEHEPTCVINIVLVDNKSDDENLKQLKKWLSNLSISVNWLKYENFILEQQNNINKSQIIGKEKTSKAIHFISSDRNLGFCDANNLGIAYASENHADYALILNNDTTIDSCALTNLIHASEGVSDDHILSPSIHYYHKKNTIWWCGGKFNRWLSPSYSLQGESSSNKSTKLVESDWVSGCATFIPIPVYKKIGLYDPKYFIWCEEWDLSLRATSKNIKLFVAPTSIVYHKVGKSLGIVSPLTFFYAFRNMIMLRKKHLSKPMYLLHSIAYIPYKFLQAIIYSIKNRNILFLYAFTDGLTGGFGNGHGKWKKQK